MWVGENESAKDWATVLNSLRNRGVEDIFFVHANNLTDFCDYVVSVFLRMDIQNCIVTSKSDYYKDIKELMADFKAVYAALDVLNQCGSKGWFHCCHSFSCFLHIILELTM